jgi:hypothetical protein
MVVIADEFVCLALVTDPESHANEAALCSFSLAQAFTPGTVNKIEFPFPFSPLQGAEWKREMALRHRFPRRERLG